MCKIKNSARLIVGFMIMFLVCYSHGNSWNVLNSGQTGGRSGGSIVYEPDSSRFFLVLGTSDDSSAYSDLVYSDRLGKWINNFPHDTLYGVWGDSIGKTKGLGRMGNAVFSNGYYFGFQNISWGGKTFLRPNLHENRRSYMQYAYNSIDKKIYAHYKGITCTYNTKTRIWDTISALPNPSSYGSAAYSRFGFMAHDPVNNEIIFAGGAIDKRDGWSGVWKLSVATRSWSKQNATVEPGPRAYASVATDPVRGKIVVFGGDHLDYLMNDTWVYDCASKTWERKRPSLAPSPRAGAAMVYMPKSGKIVLIGGFDYSNCTGYSCPIYRQIPSYEMWTYDIDANTWTLNKKFLSSERIPTVRIPDVPTAAADTSDRILLFGHSRDTTYSLVYNVSMADAQNRALLGKRDTTLYRADPWRVEWFNEGVAAPDTEVTETLLRTLTPNTWTLLSPPKKPASNHDWGTSVYDSDRDRIILFSGGHSAHCGNEVDEYTIATNRWKISYVPEWPLEETYNSGLPFLFSFSGRPMVTHSYDNYAYDTIVHKMLYIKPNYTFFYNPSVADWDSVIPNPSLFTTDYHHIAVNRTKHGSLAWVRQGSSGAYALYALDYDSLRWRLLPRTGAVLPSCYGDNGGGAYDSKRDRFVMVYCSGTTDPQVVSYDFATGVATALTPANNAIARTSYMRECVYMPEFDRIIFGAEQNGKLLAFNCESNEWEVLDVVRPTTVLSPNTRGTGFMLDTKRGLLWYHEANSMKTSVIKLTSAVFPSGSYTEKKSDKAKTYLKISPNPFNPSTSVMFSLPVAGNVTLAIYTPDGRIVKELLQSTRTEAGSHAIKLDGKELTSGAYIVKLECGNMRLQKKLVMLK